MGRLKALLVACLMQAAAAFMHSAGMQKGCSVNLVSIHVQGKRNMLVRTGVLKLQDSNILLLDHLNINHEKSRHDLLKAFYFDVLKCAVDPRKQENIDKGSGSVWANCGINQFHLPSETQAQVLAGPYIFTRGIYSPIVVLEYMDLANTCVPAGTIVLEYMDLAPVAARLATPPTALFGSKFGWSHGSAGSLRVTCPWGNNFELRKGTRIDPRGRQPGPVSEAIGMSELQINVPFGCNLAGIGRFYAKLIGAQACFPLKTINPSCLHLCLICFCISMYMPLSTCLVRAGIVF
jgi:hypothetical protein